MYSDEQIATLLYEEEPQTHEWSCLQVHRRLYLSGYCRDIILAARAISPVHEGDGWACRYRNVLYDVLSFFAEGGPELVMVIHECSEDGTHFGLVHACWQLKHECLVVVLRLGQFFAKETLLYGQHGYLAAHGLVAGSCFFAKLWCKTTDGRVLK